MPTAKLIPRCSASLVVVPFVVISSSSSGSSSGGGSRHSQEFNSPPPLSILRGGVCVTHGAEKKRCSHEGCANGAVKGGVCITHGAKVKRCNFEGCNNQVQRGGVCFSHGAKKHVYICSFEGVPNTLLASPKINLFRISREEEGLKMDAALWGVPNSVTHGATKERKRCSFKGCTKKARGKVGVCVTHGAKLKRCSQMY